MSAVGSAAGRVTLRLEGSIAHVTFARPEAHNAMSTAMYRELKAICEDIATRDGVRAAVLRGEGGKAFVAGSDIAMFADFASGEDGVRYEAEISSYVGSVAALPFPTIAVIDGWAVGGGLAIAAACDLRIAVPGARFGAPIARTVGNCLSVQTHALLVNGFGASRTKRMLLLGEMIGAREALDCGFLAQISEPGEIDSRVGSMCGTLMAHAPLTMRITKEAIRRIERGETDDADLVRTAYGSLDFKTGVSAFLSRAQPEWVGR